MGADAAFAADPPPRYLFARPAIMSLMRRACDYQLAEQAKTRHSNNWIRSTFCTGLLATYRTAGKDPKYKDAAIKWGKRRCRNRHRVIRVMPTIRRVSRSTPNFTK